MKSPVIHNELEWAEYVGKNPLRGEKHLRPVVYPCLVIQSDGGVVNEVVSLQDFGIEVLCDHCYSALLNVLGKRPT